MKFRARDSYLYAAIVFFGYLLLFDRPLLVEMFFDMPWWAWALLGSLIFLVLWALLDRRRGGKT
jgi:hypothetical protein